MGYTITQNQTAKPLLFKMKLAGTANPATGLSPTVTLSKNGGAFGSPAGAVSEIGSGWYKVAGNATDSNTLGPLALYATGTGADPTDELFEVTAYDPYDATRIGLGALPNASAGGSGGLPTMDVNLQVHADIRYVNAVLVGGAGTIGNPWGPG